jgi:hypothetical protein
MVCLLYMLQQHLLHQKEDAGPSSTHDSSLYLELLTTVAHERHKCNATVVRDSGLRKSLPVSKISTSCCPILIFDNYPNIRLQPVKIRVREVN